MSTETMESSYTPQQRFEASRWFVDIQEADEPSPELLQRWSYWLDESEGNRLAFEAVERAWHGAPVNIEAGESASRTNGEPYDGEVPVTEWLQRAATRQAARRRPLFGLLMAASVVFALAGWWAFERFATPARYSVGQFATGTGEHMDVALTDGSHVSLGARSRLAVDFTAGERRLRLDAGEAFFTVSRDPARPFSVRASGGVITALGTAFNVRTMENRVTVVVTEGAVNVRDVSMERVAGVPQAASVRATRLGSGEQLTFTARGALASVEKVSLSKAGSAEAIRWREGWLIYRDEPLRSVIADVARYTDRHVAVSGSVDPALRFTGAVYKDSVVEWLEALPEVFPVSIRADGREVVIAPP